MSNSPLMNPSPSGDEELHAVRPESASCLSPDAASERHPLNPAGATSDPSIKGGGLWFVGSILLIALTFSIGLSYLLEKRWLHSPEETAETSSPALNANIFHVSHISLGSTRLAILNGREVTESESVVVPIPGGTAAVRVIGIEDGVVHLVFGRKQFDVKVTPTVAKKTTP